MRRLIISPSARQDLQAVHDYIAHDDIDAAFRLLDRFESRFAMICDYPGIGKARQELQPGIRCCVEGNYLIMYRLIASASIEIVRVLHSKQNVRKIIGRRR